MKIKKFVVGIKGLKESLTDFADTWKKLEAGKRVKKEEGIYFESVDAMRSVLTNKRLLILKTIKEKEPGSVYELAKLLNRDLKNINQDVKLLAEVGLVTLEKIEKEKNGSSLMWIIPRFY